MSWLGLSQSRGLCDVRHGSSRVGCRRWPGGNPETGCGDIHQRYSIKLCYDCDGDIMGISWGYHGNIMAIFCKKNVEKKSVGHDRKRGAPSSLHSWEFQLPCLNQCLFVLGILMGRCLVIKMGSYPLKNGSTMVNRSTLVKARDFDQILKFHNKKRELIIED